MITISNGNLLEADVEALVNTVNCVGYMGKGIALQFKKAFPENFKVYQKACNNKEVQPGHMFVFLTGLIVNPKFIINFPTKRHWRGKSQIMDIELGLHALATEIKMRDIKSIAIPPLGCGLGGLKWSQVRPLVENALAELHDVKVLLFEPAGAPEAKNMPIGTIRPGMTVARALLIVLMKEYSELGYRLTLLEIQKLAYFLQEVGQPLRLNFGAGHYGPYAPNLNKVLELLEGHFISGYGDSQKPDVEIQLLEGASEEADLFLKKYEEERNRLNKVNALIDGFKTPYGMELLSTTHWLASYGAIPARTVEDSIAGMAEWSPRKKDMFCPEHIRIAWERLAQEGWLKQMH